MAPAPDTAGSKAIIGLKAETSVDFSQQRAIVRSKHPKKEIEQALQEAEAAGMIVEDGRGHWGVLWCPGDENDRCPRPLWVWSTPKNVQNHAKQIRRYTARYTHRPT